MPKPQPARTALGERTVETEGQMRYGKALLMQEADGGVTRILAEGPRATGAWRQPHARLTTTLLLEDKLEDRPAADCS
jgi:hypothetical protein